MKKVLFTALLCASFSLAALADGDGGVGNKSCTTNCLANPDTQVEMTKVAATSKSLSETANDYFSKMVNYFIEITF
jgi:hypothetical protein